MTPETGDVIKRAKTVLSFVFIIFIAFAFSSCDLILQAANRAAGAAKKEITEFIFTAALNGSAGVTSDFTGAINGTEITVTVPYGTNLTALVASYSTTGATVRVGSVVQESGVTANNFTNAVIYTVMAADKSTSDYTVRALPHPAIASFAFVSPAVTGTINHGAKTIAVIVPYGTNLTSLVAKFTTTGVSVKVGSTEQMSGIAANDFTNPVSYTVTAADGSTVDYKVTVTVNLTAKDITSFTFASPAVAGKINEAAKTISLTVPYGTNLASLVAIFSTTGVSVKVGSTEQVSGITPNDFTNPVTYVVSAADSTTKSYQVTVTVAPNPAKDITSFSFAAALNIGAGLTRDCLGIISGTNISVTIPYGVDVTSLIATFTTTGAEVKVGSTVQVSGVTHNDFTNPVTYVVRAEDSTTKSYITKVTHWETVGSEGFSASYVWGVHLAFDSLDTPYVGYQDDANGNKTTVMKYSGGSWQAVGTPGFSEGHAGCCGIVLNSSNTPYIAFVDGVHDHKATVMNYSGGVWQVVGTAGFSTGEVLDLSFALDSSDTPYVAFMDGTNGKKATVMKYSGGSWQVVGTAGFSEGEIDGISFAIDSSDTLYVAYCDDSYNGRATVMKYSGGSWQVVGTPGFTIGSAYQECLALDSSDTPYVAFMDFANSQKASVMKYQDGSWQFVGTAGFTASEAGRNSFALDFSDTPYIAFSDKANGYRATVMKYSGGSWQVVGEAGFSGNQLEYISLALDSSGIPYVAYQDTSTGGRATVKKLSK